MKLFKHNRFARFWGDAPIWTRWFLASAVLMMMLSGGFDAVLSAWLVKHSWQAFAAFQDRSLFEDGVIGGSDFGLLLQIGSVVAFVFHWVSDRSGLYKPGWKRFNAAFALSSLHIGMLVHGLKLTWARARPYVVASSDVDAYSPWFRPGRLSLVGSDFNGSFPSGHSAAAAAFFALVFYVPSSFQSCPSLYRFCAFSLAFFSWGSMLIARPMSRAHYVTDCLASGIIVVFSLTLFNQIFGLGRAGRFLPSQAVQNPFRRVQQVFLGTCAFLGAVLVVRLFA